MKLTAFVICREAILRMRNERTRPTPQIDPWPESFAMHEPRPGIFHENVAITDKCLETNLGVFSEKYVQPAMRRLAIRLGSTPLGSEFMELPKGVDDSANERYDGLAIRCIIDMAWPLRGQVGPWSRVMEYYDIQTDSLKTGPCGIGVVFTVHEPGMESALRIPIITPAKESQ